MAFQDYLTVEGERMLAKAAAGTKIRFTKLVMGSGEITNGISEKDIKEVIEPKHTVDIGGVLLNGNDSVLIAAVFTNAEISEGFYFREKAIYVTDGVDEVLAIYGNAREQAEYIDTASFTVIEKRIRSILKLTQSELSNIVLSSAICAVAPIIVDDEIDSYICTAKANIIEVGQVLIANRQVYTYIGDDPHDRECYYSCSGNKIEIDIDDIQKAFDDVFMFIYIAYASIIEEMFHNTYTKEPQYILDDTGLTWEDYGTEMTAEEMQDAIGASWDGEEEEYYDEYAIIIEDDFAIVFGSIIDNSAMSAEEIEIAINTPWTGESSSDPTAMSAEEIEVAINTPWTGQSSSDPTALSATEIELAIKQATI